MTSSTAHVINAAIRLAIALLLVIWATACSVVATPAAPEQAQSIAEVWTESAGAPGSE